MYSCILGNKQPLRLDVVLIMPTVTAIKADGQEGYVLFSVGTVASNLSFLISDCYSHEIAWGCFGRDPNGALVCSADAVLRPLYGDSEQARNIPHWRPGISFGEFAHETLAPLFNDDDSLFNNVDNDVDVDRF